MKHDTRLERQVAGFWPKRGDWAPIPCQPGYLAQDLPDINAGLEHELRPGKLDGSALSTIGCMGLGGLLVF
jgi:hypothetical protein